jgi:hypothetical protein
MTAAAALGRMALRGARNRRFWRAGYGAARATAISVGRVFRRLFLQIAGLLFCLFAAEFALRLPRAYRDQLTGRLGWQHLSMLAIFTVVFAWFGATSFWRTRKR